MRITTSIATVTIMGSAVLTAGTDSLNAQASSGSAGPLAQSCGVPPPSAKTVAVGPSAAAGPPVFPNGQYPVALPSVSLLGARNDLRSPYRSGVSWGQLPEGRRWGSTASVTTAPDGTIWVADRCGNSGAGGATCGGASANIDPIFQLDTSGRLLRTFGAGMFVSPHKLAVDRDGFLWLADNGGHQVFKLSQEGYGTGRIRCNPHPRLRFRRQAVRW
jgi:NHL repeat